MEMLKAFMSNLFSDNANTHLITHDGSLSNLCLKYTDTQQSVIVEVLQISYPLCPSLHFVPANYYGLCGRFLMKSVTLCLMKLQKPCLH